MDIWLKASVDRTDGKQMSSELVGEALVALVEGEALDVEDSVFEVTTAEAVAGPKAQAQSMNVDALLLGVDALFKAFHEANPINLDGPGEPVEWTAQDKAIIGLQTLEGIGPAIVEAQARAARARGFKASKR